MKRVVIIIACIFSFGCKALMYSEQPKNQYTEEKESLPVITIRTNASPKFNSVQLPSGNFGWVVRCDKKEECFSLSSKICANSVGLPSYNIVDEDAYASVCFSESVYNERTSGTNTSFAMVSGGESFVVGYGAGLNETRMDARMSYDEFCAQKMALIIECG